ncbi:MAG TPA: universal stress protein [Polyangia bacterium]|jgi:nucleotide-binding universal stress UspA family protein|nr:universal stress protein [Polyangia bacterium]
MAMQLQKILCAVDFSAASRAALHVATDLAQKFGASLTLLHVYQAPVYPLPDGYIPMRPTVVTEAFERIDHALAEWSREAKERGVAQVEALSVQGSPWHEVVRYAREQRQDLIVVGKHGHSGLRDRLIGSVAERVVRHAPCPVLTVHAEDDPAAAPAPQGP